jgi:signal transduction histidine kinase
MHLGWLFDTSDFPARWYCGAWTPLHGWTHIISDVAIWGAYMAIPCVLVSFVIQRKDIPFPRVFWLFGLFIVACGLTHLTEAVIFWHPVYRISAAAKLVTAVVSWLTVFAIIRVMPIALRYPGYEVMNIQLRQANADLEDFARVVSHDLRAPLRGIRRLSEWLEEGLPKDDAEARANIADLQERVDHMERLIEGVLAYSQALQTDSRKTLVDTGQLCAEAVERVIARRDIAVKQQGAFPHLEADPTQIYQIFQNLLDNAARHCPDMGARIEIAVTSSRLEHHFVVRDNGCGIAPEVLETLLRPVSPSEQILHPGGGIGLNIVTRIVQRNGGRVWVESEPGQGAAFHFTLPAATVVPRAWYNRTEAATASEEKV